MFLETNPYGIKTIRLTFDENNEIGTIRYSYSEPLNRQKGTLESPFGLDGVYRISNTSMVLIFCRYCKSRDPKFIKGSNSEFNAKGQTS